MQAYSSVPVSEVIYLVDNDEGVLGALSDLLTACGRNAVCFTTAKNFLSYDRTDSAACLILDLQMPDANGFDLPIIFTTGSADIPSTVRAMKAGAVEVLTEPVSPTALLAAVDTALLQDREQRGRYAEFSCIQRRFRLLTPREREVFHLVVEGLLNKQAAAELGISEVTLQVHRGQVMRKMAAPSFAALVRMAMALSSRLADFVPSRSIGPRQERRTQPVLSTTWARESSRTAP